LERVRNEARDQTQLFLDGIESMNVEKLKKEVLILRDGIKQAELALDHAKAAELQLKLGHVIEQLGARGGEAEAVWLLANSPEAMHAYIDGWADAKPEEAFHFIERSNRPGVCSSDTVMELLNVLGKDDPQALRSAVKRVPWDLFMFEDWRFVDAQEGRDGPRIQDTENAEIWWKSGVARELAEDGVYIGNLFSIWGREDLSGAVAAWAEWPGQEHGQWGGDLYRMMLASAETEEGKARAHDALMPTDEIVSKKIRIAIFRMNSLYPSLTRTMSGSVPAIKEMLGTSASPP
jgi:hypothetical protein